ncbi:DUF5996 family protein [Streptomyces reniochalinae]|uniref:Ava_C0101 and related proteins n=1 Tax=Streptomyces reniochalinae TaxID=2250578 RepID=A0A367ET04_9ACTN|nr:DUF5996 family protein [Streptomyces reniochalinae]RCG20310.1 hypothetical protein DQ392_09970 [Streptomyces reniochalinae]
MTTGHATSQVLWPSLRVEDWSATRDTLHMWTQIVGKIRLKHAPMVNHWWQVCLQVSSRGLIAPAIPYHSGVFDIEFDFLGEQLHIRTSVGDTRRIALQNRSVADFHAEVLRALGELHIEAAIQPHPNEVEPAVQFADNFEQATYDPEAASAFWRQLMQAYRVMDEFRARFVGKASPVQFFWGSMDLACARFSGRTAPPHPGGAPHLGDWVMREAYSRELSSCGFWPGGGEEGAFYSYAYPAPTGFDEHEVAPEAAFFSADYGEFLLPYEAVRTATDPEGDVLRFLQTTYEAAADRGGWDRGALEEDPARWDDQYQP